MKKILFAFLIFFLIRSILYSQSWYPLGSGLSQESPISHVYSLKVFNNELVAGGTFSIAGGISVSSIAKWNGANWSAFSVGSNNCINVFEIYNNQLIAGGNFTTIGGINAGAIAKWNGTSWSAFGSGLTGGGSTNSVGALAIFNNSLIAGGNFTYAGGVSANNIAKWDGVSWTALGSGIRKNSSNLRKIYALCVYKNELYAGGNFDSAGSISASNIAKWNGSSWSSVGSGVNMAVYALTIYNDELVVGGGFSAAGGISAPGIAKWNGSSWSTLGSGMGGTFKDVFSLYVYNNQLIAGGYFTIAGGVNANRIAKWNGTGWSALSNGVSVTLQDIPVVNTITKYNNDLVVGGVFIVAGIYAVYNIAKWGMSIDIKNISTNIPDKFSLEQNYPNPFNPTTNIRYQVKDLNFVTLKVFDNLGKEVETLVNEKQSPGTYEISFDGSALTSGVYYYTLTAGNFKETKKMLLIK